jgi:hypothetical protein
MNLEAEYLNRLEAIYLKELKMASGRKRISKTTKY